MVKVTIDNVLLEVPDGFTVMQACEKAGKEIPRFCYHEKLKIAGNCRMCLVEIEKTPKPQASCAYPVSEGMVIKTNTETVKKAREGVLEFLLINHPLDCPICDEAGECDLQDQTYHYARGNSRYHENKRAVEEKNFGPLIKTYMTRCIHCTRCIRFSSEIAGNDELGATGRGENMEVGTYIEKAISSELSGNIIDICPVGALTSRPYAFKARSWELQKTESIDVLDAVGSNIRIDTRGLEVMRILPRSNDLINEEWISDKTRFSYDGLAIQRLDRPYVTKAGKLKEASWEEALLAIKYQFNHSKPDEIAAIAGNLSDLESIFMLKKLMDKIGSPHLESRTYYEKLDGTNRASYLFNTGIERIEESDLCLIVGAHPRHDAPLVNARIRKRYLQGGLEVAVIGDNNNLTYKVTHLGNDPKILEQILAGTHDFSKKLVTAKKPMIILGVDVLARKDGSAIAAICQEIANKFNLIQDGWNGYNILHKAASRVGALDIGFFPGKNGYDLSEIIEKSSKKELKLIFMLGGDEISDTSSLKNTFVVYIGHHGDRIAEVADIILPSAAYTEKSATYLNLEGRVQRTKRATSPPGKAKEDWLVISEIANILGLDLDIRKIQDLRKEMSTRFPHLGKIGQIFPAQWKSSSSKVKILTEAIKSNPYNFYMTDPISRASRIMAECSREFHTNQIEKVT